MQKHERQAFAAVKGILEPKGFAVSVCNGNRAKVIIWAEGHGFKDRKTLSSSPKEGKHDVDHAAQWARRLAKRVAA